MTEQVRIAIIGAASSYTPELIEGIIRRKGEIPVGEVRLMDIDEERLEIMAGFCRRFAAHLGHEIPLRTMTERREAIEGADFVVVQIRVGGNAARVLDETIPARYGLIGQETTGAGGMLKAFRTIPVMLDIARDMARYAPDGWLINYTNPTGLLTDALTRHTTVKSAGLCSGGLFPAWITSRALEVPPEGVSYDYVGLNHLNFAYNLRVNGRALTDEEFDRVAEVAGRAGIDASLIRMLRLIPSPYLQYYFHTSRQVKEQAEKELTRGQEVQRLVEEAYRAYSDVNQRSKPEALSKRGGGGYSEVAIGLMAALQGGEPRIIITNVANRGAVPGLPVDAAVEIPAVVNRAGIHPLSVPEVPSSVWGLIAAVKNYEQLAVDAAVSGDREKALLALLAHPLVGDYDIALPLLDEMLEANREYLPQFFA